VCPSGLRPVEPFRKQIRVDTPARVQRHSGAAGPGVPLLGPPPPMQRRPQPGLTAGGRWVVEPARVPLPPTGGRTGDPPSPAPARPLKARAKRVWRRLTAGGSWVVEPVHPGRARPSRWTRDGDPLSRSHRPGKRGKTWVAALFFSSGGVAQDVPVPYARSVTRPQPPPQ
jgi:hypothetical protein